MSVFPFPVSDRPKISATECCGRTNTAVKFIFKIRSTMQYKQFSSPMLGSVFWIENLLQTLAGAHVLGVESMFPRVQSSPNQILMST